MSHAIAPFIAALDLPEAAKQRLNGRDIDIHLDEDADPAIVEIQALRQSIELLTSPAVRKMRINEFLDDIKIVDTVQQRTYRDIAGDEMPVYNPDVEKALLNLAAIEETSRHLQILLGRGEKSAEKVRIQSALPTAFTNDNDSYLQQLQQGFAEWAKELDAYSEKYGKHFDDEQAQYMQAASMLAHHAEKRCADIEIGPKLALAR